MTDDHLLRKLKDHQQDALELMMKKYRPYVYTILSNMLGTAGSSEDVEELLQDTFYAIWSHADSIYEGKLKAYLIIVDGEYIENDWTSIQPRVVLGQTARLETMMVVVEGRLLDSFGCGLDEVGEVMLQYGCVQALNLDGGTSAIMYYDGEYITRCSNTALPEVRTLPTAWVYRAS